MPKWVGTLALVACLIAVLVASRVIGARRAARRRAAFLDNRSPMPDETFLATLGLADDRHRRVARAVRRAVAREFDLPPEMLHPDDKLWTLLFELRYLVPDLLDAARQAVRTELATDYDTEFEFVQSSEGTGPLDADTLRDFIGFYLAHLNRLTHSPAHA